MAKAEDVSGDGLEIVSIGALYDGPWDKKYWSSSRLVFPNADSKLYVHQIDRNVLGKTSSVVGTQIYHGQPCYLVELIPTPLQGKDRYPYPVGYHAIRTQNGVTYKMEIHEGSAGPVFQITSSDRHCVSGQTPDIAWEAFHKKNARVKLWHSKRFSCKVDGVEFFGFRNPFVQRLLRELLARSNGASDHSIPSSKIGNKRLAKDRDLPSAQPCGHPDLLPYLAKSRITGKRSKKHITTNLNSAWKSDDRGNIVRNKISDRDENPATTSPFKVSSNSFKDVPRLATELSDESLRFFGDSADKHNAAQPEEKLLCISSHLTSTTVKPGQIEVKLDRLDCVEAPRVGPSVENNHKLEELQVVDDSEAVEDSENVKHNLLYAPDTLDSQQVDDSSPNIPIMKEPCKTKDEVGACKTVASGGSDGQSCPEEKADMYCSSVDPSVENNHKHEESQIVNDTEIIQDSEISKHSFLYAPDTFDTQQADTSLPNIPIMNEPCETTGEVGASKTGISGGLGGESCPEEEAQMFDSNDSVDKGDHDIIGDEVVRSVLALLLPQAPTFTYSRRKKRRHNPMTVPSSAPTDDNNQIPSSVNAASVGCMDCNGQSMEQIPSAHPGSAVQSKENSIAPDSPGGERYQGNLTDQAKEFFLVAEAVDANLGKHNSTPNEGQMLSTADFVTRSGTDHSCTDLQRKNEIQILHAPHIPTTTSEKAVFIDCFQDGQSEANLADQILPPPYISEIAPHCSEVDKSIENYASISASKGNSHGWEVPELDSCLPLQDTSLNINCQSSKGESDNAFDCHGGWIQCNTLEHADLKISAEEQPFTTVGNGPAETSISQSSAVELSMQNYRVPLSESIICRNTGDHNLAVASPFQEAPSCSYGNKNIATNATSTSTSTRQRCDLLEEKLHESGPHNKLECNAKLIGCYSHPKRISSVMLKQELDNIYVCTSCGLLEERGRDLYIHKLRSQEPNLGCPSFIGYSTMILPTLKDAHGREIAVERFGMQFTPDAGGLILVDNIQVPYCSERNFNCLCATCASTSFEENAVKIVRVKQGFVSLMVKLKTVYPVNCVLVCEPDCLVAVDESGRLYLWFMDPAWSSLREDYVIPSYDFVASRVVELKRIPKSAGLLLGHNGCGDFSLWDINKRSILSRFSAPASSILDFIPVSLFSWKNEEQSPEKHDLEEFKDKLMDATTTWVSESNDKTTFQPTEGEDMGIWLLVCTASDFYFQPNNYQIGAGSWRLGLLVKNTVILGDEYPRSAAIGVSAGCGIIGTDEGLAYSWDLQTGSKVDVLHNFKGVGVSHIATDDSVQSATAVGGDNGQLWIYLRQ